MTVELTRRGFLAGILTTAVIVALPKTPALPAAAPAPIDPFSIKAPPGLRYQWVRTALMGEPDPLNVEARINNGWTFVEPITHPGAPVSTVEHAIESRGLILMQKPEAEVRAAEAVALRSRLNPNLVLVETPHGFEIQAKPKESDSELEDCELQQPHEGRHRQAS